MIKIGSVNSFVNHPYKYDLFGLTNKFNYNKWQTFLLVNYYHRNSSRVFPEDINTHYTKKLIHKKSHTQPPIQVSSYVMFAELERDLFRIINADKGCPIKISIAREIHHMALMQLAHEINKCQTMHIIPRTYIEDIYGHKDLMIFLLDREIDDTFYNRQFAESYASELCRFMDKMSKQ